MKKYSSLIPKLLAVLLLMALSLSLSQAQTPNSKSKVTVLDKHAAASMDILKGPPGTVTMRSGYVVLAPGETVGKHSTKDYEEVVITLAGTGEMRTQYGDTLKLKPFTLCYGTPKTEHDVINTGTDTLRYIWLVAKAPTFGKK